MQIKQFRKKYKQSHKIPLAYQTFFFILLFLIALPFANAQLADEDISAIAEKNTSIICNLDVLTNIIKCDNPSVSNVSHVDNVENVKNVQRLTNQSSIHISGTEYQVGDSAKVFLQLIQGSGFIDNATCHTTIYKPDSTKLYTNQKMSHLENGIYQFDFTAPNITGVFPVTAVCQYVTQDIIEFADKEAIINGTNSTGTINDTNSSNNVYRVINDVSNKIEVNYNFSNISYSSDISSMDVNVEAHLQSGGTGIANLTFYMFNFNTSEFDELSNSITQTGTGADVSTSNDLNIPLNYLTGNSSNSTAILKLIARRTSGNLEKIHIDFMHLDLSIFLNETPVSQLQESSELHITSTSTLSFLDLILSYITDTIIPDLLNLIGITTQTQEILNTTREQLTNLSNNLNAMNISNGEQHNQTRTQLANLSNKINAINTSNNEQHNQTRTQLANLSNNLNAMNISNSEQHNQIRIQIANHTTLIQNVNNSIISEIQKLNTSLLSQIANLTIINNIISNQTQILLQNSTALISINLNNATSLIIKAIQNQTEISMFGTEYEAGDKAKIWLQLLQGGNPIRNANCLLDIYYPNNTLFVQSAPMSFLNNSRGEYYYDLFAPNSSGIYSTSAQCFFSFNTFTFYNPEEFPNLNEVAVNNTGFGITTGSFFNINQKDDSLYVQHASTTAGSRKTNLSLEWNLSKTSENLTNVTQISILFFGQSDKSPTTTMSIFNFNTSKFENLPNTLTYTAQTSPPTAFDEFFSNIVPNSTNYISANNIIRINFETKIAGGTNFNVYYNEINLNLNAVAGQTISDIKGASELHVERHFITLNDLINNVLSGQNSTNNIINAINTSIQQQIAEQIQSLNNSLQQELTEINSSLQSQIINQSSIIQNQITSVNASVQQKISDVNVSLSSQISSAVSETNISIQLQLQAINSSIQSQLAFILNEISRQLQLLNQTSINNISNVNSNMQNNFNALNLNIQNNFTFTNSLISQLSQQAYDMNISLQNYISEINKSIITSIEINISNKIDISTESILQSINTLNSSIRFFIELQNNALNDSLQSSIQQNILMLNISLQSFISAQTQILNSSILLNTTNAISSSTLQLSSQMYAMNISLQNFILLQNSNLNQSIITSIENNFTGSLSSAQQAIQQQIYDLNDSLQSFIRIQNQILNASIILNLSNQLSSIIFAPNISVFTNISVFPNISISVFSNVSVFPNISSTINFTFIENETTNITINNSAFEQNFLDLNMSLQSFIAFQSLMIKSNMSNSQTSIENLIRAINLSLENEIVLQQHTSFINITTFVGSVNISLSNDILTANRTTLITNSTINNLNLNQTNFFPANETATLQVGFCATNTSQTLMIWLFVGISLILLFLALKFTSAITGVFAGLCMFISAIYISPCGIGLGIILGGLGIIQIIVFAFLFLKSK